MSGVKSEILLAVTILTSPPGTTANYVMVCSVHYTQECAAVDRYIGFQYKPGLSNRVIKRDFACEGHHIMRRGHINTG